MPLWKIYPVAGLQDPRWEGRCIWKDVVVRAPSAAMARLVAAAMERDLDIRIRGDERLCFRSGFQDEKIYWVSRINAEDAADRKSVVEGKSVSVRVNLVGRRHIKKK